MSDRSAINLISLDRDVMQYALDQIRDVKGTLTGREWSNFCDYFRDLETELDAQIFTCDEWLNANDR